MPEPALTTAQLHAAAEVRTAMPALMRQRHRLQRAGIQPTGVLLPQRLNHPVEGGDPVAAPATVMGLPVAWATDETWALLVDVAL